MRTRLFVPGAALALALGLTAPALASFRHAAPRQQDGGTASRSMIPTTQSTTFAGYQINAKGGHMEITAAIVVPKLKCTKVARAIGASVGLYEDSTTTNFSSANLFIGCVHGKARYFPFLTVGGAKHESNLTKTVARPGDTVLLEVVANHTETTVEVIDQTHAFDKSKAGPAFRSFVGYPWIGDVTWGINHRIEGVPHFGKITFSTATIDGNPFGGQTPQERFNRYNKAKTKLQIATGGYTSSGSSGLEQFSTLFRHS